MDQDLGGFEDLTDDDGIASFLAENLGEIDHEFLEEFRSSNLFDEFIQQLNIPPNQSTPPGSRRSSITDLQVEARASVNNSDGKEGLAGPSTSKDCLTRSINYSDSSDQNKKRKTPSKSSNSATVGEHQRKEIPKSRKNKSENTVEDELHPNAQSSKKNKSATKSGLSSCENETEKADRSNERKHERREAHRKNRFIEQLSLGKPNVRLYDLVMMKHLFPNGVSRVILTPRLLKEIRSVEREILSTSTEACKKFLKKNNPTPLNKSTGKQTFKPPNASDGLKQNAKVGTSKSSSSTNFATKIGQVLDNEQPFQSKKRQENRTSIRPINSESSGKEAKKVFDASRKMPSPFVASNTKSSNHATKTDHYADKSDSSRNDKIIKNKYPTAVEASKREQTNKCLKSSVEEMVPLEKKNIDKKATPTVGLSANEEKRNRGRVVNLYVPLFGIVKQKKDTPYKKVIEIDVESKEKSLTSDIHEKPQRSSTLECVGSKVICEKIVVPLPVQLEPDKPPTLECRLIKNVDEKVVTPKAVYVELEVSPPLKSQEITDADEKKKSSQAVHMDVRSSLLECQGSKSVVETQESPQAVHTKPESFSPLECQGGKNVDEMDTLQAVKADSEVASPMECQESMDAGDNVILPSNAHVESESSPALECPKGMKVNEEVASPPTFGSIVVNEAVQADCSIVETFTDSQHLSPDNTSDVQNSGSPEETRKKSASPERSTYKRKNVIESSSDDDKRIDAADDIDPQERKRSSDEEQLRKSLPFERKRDQEDSRSKKFDKFENERQRKLGEKKKGNQKPKESMALEVILKEKPLSGSFRIPKKATGTSRRLPKSALTPLASAAAPKESMQFERCRKTTEKDWRDKDYSSKGRDFSKDYIKCEDNDFSGKNFPNRRKQNKGPGQDFQERSRNKDKDDGRVVLLAPNSMKQEAGPSPSPPRSLLNAEHEWGNDGAADLGGATSSSSSDDANVCPKVEDSTKQKPLTPKIEIKEESMDEEVQPTIDPEVPVEFPQGNIITSGVLYFLSVDEKIDLPDIKSMESKDATVMKLAWWFSNIDPENAVAVDGSDAECDDKSDEEGASNRNFLKKLDFTESDEEDLFPHGSSDPRRKPYMGLVGEACGRALLRAQYRSGPGDKFENIFNLRSGASYEKENFQASCTLCDSLVVGKIQLADHVSSDEHKLKMSKAGLGDVNDDNVRVSSDNKNGNDKMGRDKISESEDKRPANSKQKEVVKISRSRATDESRDKKKAEDPKKKEDNIDKHDSSEKRKRSKDDASNDDSRKNKVDTDKSGAKAERRHSRSRGNRSRSRSPRHKRTRSRSPRRRSRSPHAHRRRSRSIQRIPRSPSKLREQKRRSTSAERVEKFLAKTNVPRRRSRSPSKGYSRKRHRRSKSPMSGHVLPRRDNREFNEKLTLTAEGKWTDEMEQQWKLMEADLAIFMEQYGEKKQTLNDSPESHPNYGDEWTAFWEKRYSEVQKEGLDADEYDYIPEWKEYWAKRLRDLLDTEYEKGVKEIKQKYGMDLDSLHKIRLTKDTNKTVTLKVQETEPPPPSAMSTPQDLATPSTPSSIAPSNHGSVPLVVAKSICSNVSANGEDYTARSMSISDCGDGDNRSDRDPNVTSAKGVTISTPAPTAVDIMSQWEKLRSGELVQQPQPSNSSIPRSKHTDNMSNEESGSIDSFDFDGFDLTQVLRLMSNLEDQLSFLAEKVKEYFKKAEELDLKKKNKSYRLLEDEEFVVMLFTVRDRFMAMIRANVLSKDVLKSLNYTVYALNSILKAPQCQKHRAKSTAATAGFETGKNEPDLPKTVNTKLIEASSSPPARSKNHLMNIQSSTKGKIAALITEFLQNMGSEDLNDAELRELLKKLLPSTVQSGGIVSKSQQSSKQPERKAEEANVSMDSWRPEARNVTKTCFVVTTGAEGSTLQFPTLPDVIVPVPAPVHDRGHLGLGSREDVWSSTLSQRPDNVSSSDSRSRSPFSRRDFTGNPTANTFRDKGRLNAHSLLQTELDNHYRISEFDDALPDGYSQGMRRKRSDPEIMLDQVTQRSCRDHAQSSPEGSPHPVNNPMFRLVKGINNIIDKERSSKDQVRKQVYNSAQSSDVRRGRERQKKRKKRKLERQRRYRSSSNSSSNSSISEREHRLKRRRKKRKKRKDENTEWIRPSAAASDISIVSMHSSIKSVQVYCRKDSKSSDSASLRESNSRTRRASGQHFNETSLVDHPTETVESRQSKSRQSVRINIPTTFQLNNCTSDALSEISSIGDAKKQARDAVKKQVIDKDAAISKEILSVSKAFWTADGEENETVYSSISSNEIKEPEKGGRQYKIHPTRKNIEKEPGEITDSTCSQDS